MTGWDRASGVSNGKFKFGAVVRGDICFFSDARVDFASVSS